MRRAATAGCRCCALAGCDDMIHQAKRNAYANARVGPGPIPAGIVEHQSKPVVPPPVTLALLQRGQERFRIYCTPCHSELGDGHGMIVQRGFSPPPSYHTQRLREAPVQHFYDVITNGYGVMYSFAYRVQPADRWAIAAYISALQRSQNATARRPDTRAEGGPAMTATARPAWILAACGLALAALGWVLDPWAFTAAGLRRLPCSPPGRSAAWRCC